MQELRELAKKVRSEMKPESRGAATAGTLEQLASLVPDGTEFADIVAAWKFLSAAKEADDGPIKGRRATCKELAELAELAPAEAGEAKRAIPVWVAWQNNFAASEDPRHKSMATTFSRELRELERELENA